MRSILAIELSGFYIKGFPDDRPTIIHHGGFVIDACPAARARKVTIGRTVQEAKLILREHGRYVLLEPSGYAKACEQWLNILFRFSGVIEPELPHQAFVDLSDHPRPAEIAAMLLHDLAVSTQLDISCGIAPTKWLARLSASHCHPEALRLGILPAEPIVNASEWLSSRSVRDLTPLSDEIIERLVRLGAPRVRDVQRLSSRVLAQQFKRQAPLVEAVARGAFGKPVQCLWPPKSLFERLTLENGADGEAIKHGLQRLGRVAAARLSSSEQEAMFLVLTVGFESGRHLEFSRTCKQPLRSALHLTTHLNQLFDRIMVDEAVESLRVSLLNLEPAKRRQDSLYHGDGSDVSAAEEVIERLRRCHGPNSLFRASEVTLSYEAKVLKEWKRSIGWS